MHSDTFASFLYAAMIWKNQPTVVMHIKTWYFLGCYRYTSLHFYLRPRQLYQLMKLNFNSTYIFLNTDHNIV